MPPLIDKHGKPIVPSHTLEQKITALRDNTVALAEMIENALPNPMQVLVGIAKTVGGTIVYSTIGATVTVGICVGGTAVALYYSPNVVTALCDCLKRAGATAIKAFADPPNQTACARFDPMGNRQYPNKETQETFENAHRIQQQQQQQAHIQTTLQMAQSKINGQDFETAKSLLDQIRPDRMLYTADREHYHTLTNTVAGHFETKKQDYLAKQQQDTLTTLGNQIAQLTYNHQAPGPTINQCCRLVNTIEDHHATTQDAVKRQWLVWLRIGQVKESLMRSQYSVIQVAPSIAGNPDRLKQDASINRYRQTITQHLEDPDLWKTLDQLPVDHPAIKTLTSLLTEYATLFEPILPDVSRDLRKAITKVPIQSKLSELAQLKQDQRNAIKNKDTIKSTRIQLSLKQKGSELVTLIQGNRDQSRNKSFFDTALATLYEAVPEITPAALTTEKARMEAQKAKATTRKEKDVPSPPSAPNELPQWLASSRDVLKELPIVGNIINWFT